jgi:acyl-CoA synthetase (NDP forming)
MALAGRIGFSRFVSLGNKADVNEVDLLEAWEDDPGSRVILAYIEGLPDGQKFMEVARRVTRKKPVVAVKSGVTRSGARAVSSHTGSLAGSEAAYHAAFRQAGVIRAESMEHLFDLALAFAYQPLPRGRPYRHCHQRRRSGHPGHRRAGARRPPTGALPTRDGPGPHG